jgi:hypothetical protein
MDEHLITEAKRLCEEATPGPWEWDVIDAHKCICLESARWKVMDFARYGMNGAAPRFLVDGFMRRADELLKSLPGKEHHRGFDNYIDHPDAAFIARSRTLIPKLVAALEEAITRAEKAESERDQYKAALKNWHEDGVYAPEEDRPCQEDT